VFDPLAITLVIATNQAFKGKRKDEVTIHDTIQVTVQETDQVPTNHRPSTDQVNDDLISEEKEELFENIDYWIDAPVETTTTTSDIGNIKRLTYTKNV
jgi:hypothetical protein